MKFLRTAENNQIFIFSPQNPINSFKKLIGCKLHNNFYLQNNQTFLLNLLLNDQMFLQFRNQHFPLSTIFSLKIVLGLGIL